METMIQTTAEKMDWKVWGAAFERIENFLRAYRIGNRLLLSRLSHELLARTMRRHKLEPDADPLQVAVREAHSYMLEWIDKIIGPTDEPEAVRFARGRAAILLAGVPESRPEAFLDPSDVPPDLAERIRSTYLAAGPDLEFSNMAPRPIDLGPVSSVADETWRTFARWPVLRIAVLWALVGALLGLSFYLTRV